MTPIKIAAISIKVTWWAEDGSERTGQVSLASDASPETAAVLAQMMRLADAEAAAQADAEAADPKASNSKASNSKASKRL